MAGIRHVRLREISRPLKTTFSTSLGSKQHVHSILVTVVLDDGASGTGEIPTSIAFKQETVDVARTTLLGAEKVIKGAAIEDYAALVDALRQDLPQTPMTVSGLEVALFRAFLSGQGTSEHAYWGGSRTRIETDITIPFAADESILGRWIESAVRKGFRKYKVKVGGEPERDRAMVALVWQTLEARVPGFRLRLDGNQGYSAAAFLAFLDDLEGMGCKIELFEQPLRRDDLKGLEYIRDRCGVPILLDESVVTVEDTRRVIDNNLCDGINIKVAKSGLGESSKILELAGRNRLKLMIGCMMETAVGLSTAIFLAAGTGVFDFVDLDSVHFLHGKNEYPGMAVRGPTFSIT